MSEDYCSSSVNPSETGGGCGGKTASASCQCKRRGPVEALAREMFEALPHDQGFSDWDEFSRCHWTQHENLMALARFVLKRYEGKVFP